MEQKEKRIITRYKQLFTVIIAGVAMMSIFSGSIVLASYSNYDRSLVFTDSDIYSLPENFNSSSKIQNFLSSKGSVLASTNIPILLHKNLNNKYPLNSTQNYEPGETYKSLENQTFSFSEIVWRMSRSSLGSGCSVEFPSTLCFDNGKDSINPGFVLAQIQKESRLVYGACAKVDADSNTACQPYSQPGNQNKLQFRLDRATGYYCFETPPNPTPSQKANSCYDENPNWLIYKGLFKQVYHMIRRLRILEQMCIKGPPYSFSNSSGIYKIGETVMIDQQPVVLGNAMTCATYIYTPHFSNLAWTIMKDINALFYIGGNYNLPEGYKPKPFN